MAIAVEEKIEDPRSYWSPGIQYQQLLKYTSLSNGSLPYIKPENS